MNMLPTISWPRFVWSRKREISLACPSYLLTAKISNPLVAKAGDERHAAKSFRQYYIHLKRYEPDFRRWKQGRALCL